VRGQGVESSSHPRHVPEDLALFNARGSLELHVLDPMGQPGLTWEFVSAPNSVPGPNGDDGRGVVFQQNDSQAVT
jgi:hypothetical protein